MKGAVIMLIGERLAELRKDKGLTQKELANILFVNFRTYSSYEREECQASDDTKIKIAKYFNVSLDYLLGIIDYPRPIVENAEYIRLPKPLSKKNREHLEQYLKYLVHDDEKS